jgi:hypothetical protein
MERGLTRTWAFARQPFKKEPEHGVRDGPLPGKQQAHKTQNDRALTKGMTRYSHLIQSMVLSPLERHLNDGT